MRLIVALSSFATIVFTLLAGAGQSTPPSSGATAAFARLKGLVGQWEAHAPDLYGDAAIRLTYRLISDDSVLVETFTIDKQDLEMMTMYHLDGRQLAATHYCAVNNQVRMLADLGAMPSAAADIQRIAFGFRDGSNLDAAHKQVMDRLDVVFDDDRHITQIWRWRDETTKSGQDSAVYRYTRVR